VAIFDDLLGFGLPLLVVAAIVILVRRMLRRHRLTDKELQQLELDQQEPVTTMMLPTLTTEMTARVARDPDFELDASTVRNRQGF
jgi:hypothetical protein